MSTPAPNFYSHSVPTSPATTRSTNKGHPVTPQRVPRQHHRHSQSLFKSPDTPSSPYTPLSLRSSDTAGSSTLTTPDNISFLSRKKLAGRSPDIRNTSVESKDGSLADLAQNWRARANQHGIKVSSTDNGGFQDASHYGDDEASDQTSSDIGNDSSIMSMDESLLPPPFMSYHRRSLSQSAAVTRPRALSASMPENQAPPMSPVASRRANVSMPLASSPVRTRRTLATVSNLMSTPPPNRVLSSELKMKGSLTEPAQPRRREPFGAVPTLANNILRGSTSMNINLNHDASLDLFNINEHDYEYDNDPQRSEDYYDESFSLDLQTHTANIFGYNNGQNETKSSFNTSSGFSDPFFDTSTRYSHTLNTISEAAEHQFHANQQAPMNLSYPNNYYPTGEPLFGHYMPIPKPAFAPFQQAAPVPHMAHSPALLPPMPSFHSTPNPPSPMPMPSPMQMPTPMPAPGNAPISPTDCSVCLASYPSSLAVLHPCEHPLCSACLTSALNIVGEKDMQCAVCNLKVDDFKLVAIRKPASEQSAERPAARASPNNVFAEAPPQDLDAAMDLGFDFSDIRASTPKLELQASRGSSYSSAQNLVLRIDNVPWDITPRQITSWLQQPVERVHVLLDNKGKTLSHAYVEVKEASTAGAILRGETAHPNAAGRRERGAVLGRGKRARGVTVTRTSQEELMANLFPHWRGRFEGARPTLSRMDGEALMRSLECTLLSEGELNALRHLIQSPDSHFLKVPVLPFHSLISLLSKFPSDIDSRAFWSPAIRDKLFELACIGLQELVPRVEKARKTNQFEEEHTMDLVHDLARIAMSCQVFTSEQIRRLAGLLEQLNIPIPDVDSAMDYSSSEQGSQLHTPPAGAARLPAGERGPGACFADLAKEFGVEAQLVQALANRLAGL